MRSGSIEDPLTLNSNQFDHDDTLVMINAEQERELSVGCT
jgi:hypothetical protein